MHRRTEVVKDKWRIRQRTTRVINVQHVVFAIGLCRLVVETAQPDPVIFRAKRKYIAQRFSYVYSKATCRPPVVDVSKAVSITTLNTDFPFIPWFGRKRVCI